MPRKVYFETVPVATIAHLADRETAGAAASVPTILSLSRDRDLLLTRELILSRAGYHVRSICKLEEAIRECAHTKFDLVIIGHSLLDEEKLALEFFCQAVGKAGSSEGFSSSPKKPGATPVLLLRRPDDPHVEGADYELEPLSGPDALLGIVKSILGSSARRVNEPQAEENGG